MGVRGNSAPPPLSARAARAAAVGCVVLGGLCVLGYVLRIRVLGLGVAGMPPMTPVVAVALALGGCGLWAVAPGDATRRRARTGYAIGGVLAALGAVLLAGSATGRHLGLEHVLFPDLLDEWLPPGVTGRLAATTSGALLLAGLALALLDADAAHGYRPAQVLAPAAALVAVVDLFGQVYGLVYLYGTTTGSTMTVHAAVGVGALALGILASRPRRGVIRAFTSDGPGGAMVRRVAPSAGAIILIVGAMVAGIDRFTGPLNGLAVTVAATFLVVMLYLVFAQSGSKLDKAYQVQQNTLRELGEQRDMSQTILQSLAEGVIVIDSTGRVLQVSDRWCEILGFPPAQVIGCLPPYPWWPPESADELLALGHRVRHTVGSWEQDTVMRRRDGSRVEVLVTVSPVRDPAGMVKMVVATYRDLTERNRADAERRRMAEQLDHFFTMSNDLMCIAGVDGYFKRVNQAWERVLGRPAEELLSQPYIMFVHPDDIARTLSEIKALTGGHGSTVSYVNRYRCRDGSYRWLSWNATLAPDENIIYAAARDITAQRAADEAQARLVAIVDSTDDAIVSESRDGTITSWNRAAERIYGYRAADAVGRSIDMLFPPDQLAESARQLRLIARGESVTDHDSVRMRSDGTLVPVALTVSPIRNANGIIVGAASIARDITDRKNAEERFRRLVLNAPDAMVIADSSGTMTLVNEQTERVFGYPAEELIGQPIDLLIPQRLRPGQRDAEHGGPAGVLHGMSVGLDLHGVRRDGTEFPIEISLAPLDTEEGTMVSAAIRDVTKRKRAEERFRRLVLNAPYAMIIADATGAITLINEQTARMFGYAPEELLGQPVEALVPEHLAVRHVAWREEYLEHPVVRNMGIGMDTLVARRRDGTVFPVEISLAPLDTDEGIIICAAILDVTVRKQVEDALGVARDNALAAAQLKSQFVAMVSHEIRTPMNGVIGMTNLLLDTPLQANQRRYAQAIQTSARALLAIINDILDFSKIEAGKVSMVEADFDLGLLAEEVLQAAGEAARNRNIEIVSYYPPDLARAVRGDQTRLRQVLLNLSSNAVKFTPHGEVVLRVEPAPAGPDGRARYTFTVSDTGIGIAPEAVARLFEPFTQVDATTSRQFGGTGLGLAISRQLVELMGGRLEVDSQPGQGSHFRFTVPLSPPANPPGRPSRARDLLAGRRLLIVDDNDTVRRMLAEHATSWGMAVAAVPDATTGLAELHDAERDGRPYDIAVLDDQVTGVLSTGAAGQAAREPGVPHLSVVTLAGAEPAGEVAEVLPKPVGPSALYNCLLRLLDPQPAVARGDHTVRAGRSGEQERGLVLLAEDNDINQLVAVETLAMLGYETDVASNGIEVVRLAGTKPYKAILMDCQMPRMDGFEAARELRRREPHGAHVPIIAMTAGAFIEDRQRCLDAGMDDYLAKPIDPEDLRATLERWTTSHLASPRS